MDYCNPCRRHLNGALACPGCGTAIEELRAYAHRVPAQGGPQDPPAVPAYATYRAEEQYGAPSLAGDAHAGHEATAGDFGGHGNAGGTGGYGGQGLAGAYGPGGDQGAAAVYGTGATSSYGAGGNESTPYGVEGHGITSYGPDEGSGSRAYASRIRRSRSRRDSRSPCDNPASGSRANRSPSRSSRATWTPASVAAATLTRRSAGSGRRSTSPRASSRSTIPVTFDGSHFSFWASLRMGSGSRDS